VVEDAFLTAPEGPLATNVRLNGVWQWIAVVLGAALVAVGGLLLSPGAGDQPAAPMSWSQR
jgi:hypothetical protein